jgi:hypothetical protein
VRPTYKQTGPADWEEDDHHTIPMGTRVRIIDGKIEPWSKYIHGKLLVAPLGSSDAVWIEGDDFTRRISGHVRCCRRQKMAFIAGRCIPPPRTQRSGRSMSAADFDAGTLKGVE